MNMIRIKINIDKPIFVCREGDENTKRLAREKSIFSGKTQPSTCARCARRPLSGDRLRSPGRGRAKADTRL